MSKVVMIGIDGMDSIMLSKFAADLPNLTKLKKQSPAIKMSSVFPPDSDTAWASIYTGLNPARHGLVQFIDPLDKYTNLITQEVDNSTLQGRTFWDYAGRHDKRVCLIFPHCGYPVWPVNGVMIVRSKTGREAQTFPPSFGERFKLSQLNTVKGLPGRGKGLAKFLEANRKLVLDETEFGLKMLKEQEWDLFFTYSSAMDNIQHILWRYCDENDPEFPGDNPYRNAIKTFYCLYDEVVGRFLSAVSPETAVIILSDHGHGMRPKTLVNVNEILRGQGVLASKVTRAEGKGILPMRERMKKFLLSFIMKYELGELARRTLQLFPVFRKIYTKPATIDWKKTKAHVTDLSGLKCYSYGGIAIIRENLVKMDYQDLRQLIIKVLLELRDPDGEKIVNWACCRENLYQGEYIDKYPDIVFELREDYGAGWAIHEAVFTEAQSHNLYPGSHKPYSPVFLMANLKDKETNRQDMSLMDIAPTVLHLLGVKSNEISFDGSNIFNETHQTFR